MLCPELGYVQRKEDKRWNARFSCYFPADFPPSEFEQFRSAEEKEPVGQYHAKGRP